MGPAGFEPATSSTPGWHHGQTRRRPPSVEAKSEIIKSSDQLTKSIEGCSICHKISASNEDHLDCQQKEGMS